jgi:hypothetical protein
MKRLLKFYRYAFVWENYPLLARTLYAAWLVRRSINERAPSPHFSSALSAVEKLYLPQQANWKISDIEKIAHFAGFVVNFPVTWGKCVQQSLIIYRLLNGYGVPAKICFGVSLIDSQNDGHAWVITPSGVFAESDDPRHRFRTIYTSPRPAPEEMS